MPTPLETEGQADFHVAAANKPCKTWFKVVGNLTAGRPLVTLHGGPGATHDYMSTLTDLVSLYNIPVVLYDQIGGGRSTHIPEKDGSGAFWTEDLFCDELENLLKHLAIDDFDLLGHSWGGMLGARFASRRPKGLKHLIISDSPASMELWVEAANKLRKNLPQDVQDTLTKHEQNNTTQEKEYEAAVQRFYEQYVCRLNPWPESVKRSFGWIEEDPTVYHTMNGPSEFHINGTLKSWSIIDDLYKIDVPTLLINGRYDEAQDSVVEPFFRLIPRTKWVQLAESSHMPHQEERERYMEVVGNFLTSSSGN